MNSQITATNFAVPLRKQSAAELAELLDCDENWMHKNVGVANRYVCRPGDDPATLAAAAVRPIIEKCGPPDLLIYASASIRQCIPDTSVFVARELGLSGIPSFSLNATCLSFLIALNNAMALIQIGQYKKVLIVSAEQPTLSRNFDNAESAALFGDGAAAAMVEATDRDAGIQNFRHVTWPEHSELAQVRGGGLLRHPENDSTKSTDYLFEMDGESLMRTMLPLLKRFLDDFFATSKTDLDQIRLIVPHQASAAAMRLLDRLLQRMGVPSETTINILNDYGNCVSASMPMALAIAEKEGRLKRDDQVLLIGSAAGLSIGAAILKW